MSPRAAHPWQRTAVEEEDADADAAAAVMKVMILLPPVFQRGRLNRSYKTLQKVSPARLWCAPCPTGTNKRSTAASSSPPSSSTRRWRIRRKESEMERRRGERGEEKVEKNAGYARLIFRASEECARSPTSESFQCLCANEKRRGGGGRCSFFFSLLPSFS